MHNKVNENYSVFMTRKIYLMTRYVEFVLQIRLGQLSLKSSS
jgi:hypothetical protein